MVSFRIAVGQFRELSAEDLDFARQVGASGITLNRPALESPAWRALLGKHFANKPGEFATTPLRWEFMELLQLRKLIEDHDLTLEAIENTPYHFYDKCMLGLPGRDEQIENYCATLRNLGRAGIKVLGYHWMPSMVWRTSHHENGRGGARVTAYDHELAKDAPDSFGRKVSADELWANYEYFIKRVLPVAEEAGVRLALHPDDPPVAEVGGVARIMSGLDGFRRAMTIGDSPNHGLDFCMGTWAEMGVDTMFAAMEEFGRARKLVYVHFRNVKGCVPRFSETFLDEGDVDVVRAMRLLKDVGFDGFIIDDHVPKMTNDTVWGHRSRAYAVGYIKGLARAVGALA